MNLVGIDSLTPFEHCVGLSVRLPVSCANHLFIYSRRKTCALYFGSWFGDPRVFAQMSVTSRSSECSRAPLGMSWKGRAARLSWTPKDKRKQSLRWSKSLMRRRKRDRNDPLYPTRAKLCPCWADPQAQPLEAVQTHMTAQASDQFRLQTDSKENRSLHPSGHSSVSESEDVWSSSDLRRFCSWDSFPAADSLNPYLQRSWFNESLLFSSLSVLSVRNCPRYPMPGARREGKVQGGRLNPPPGGKHGAPSLLKAVSAPPQQTHSLCAVSFRSP